MQPLVDISSRLRRKKKQVEESHPSYLRLWQAAEAKTTYRLEKTGDRAELATFLGVSQATLTNWSGARGVSGIGRELAQKRLGCNANWIADGQGPMWVDDYINSLDGIAKSNRIQQYDAGGAMGLGGLVLPDQPHVIHEWDVSESFFATLPPITTRANLKIVTGFGDSMRGMIEPGDPILVDIGVRQCDHDGLYFFRIGNEGFIKRLQRIPKEHGFVLKAISHNRDYEPFDIHARMDFEVLGKVLMVWTARRY